MDTLNAACNEVETRSLTKQYAVAAGLTFCSALLLIVSVLVVLLGDGIARNLSVGVFGAIAWRILQWTLGIASLLLALEVIYYFVPDMKNRQWHWITPGAVASIVSVVISLGLRFYVRASGSYAAAYRSLGSVIVLLLFFYLIGVSVLFGGVVNGVLKGAADAGSIEMAADVRARPERA